MAPKPTEKRSKVSFFPFSRKNAPNPATPEPNESPAVNDADQQIQPSAPVKKGLFRRSSRVSVNPVPETPDVPQTTKMPDRSGRIAAQQRGREQSNSRNTSVVVKQPESNSTAAQGNNKNNDNAAEDGRPSLNKKSDNSRNKSWFSWNASKKTPELTDAAAEAAAAATAAAADDPFAALMGDDGPRITRDGGKGPHALARIATARTNRQLSMAGNKSVRWSYEDLQARGPPPFELGGK